MIRQGKLRGNKVLYPDGISCCIWRIYPDITDDEGFGPAWDFPFDEMDDLIALLQQLEAAEAEVYQEDE